MDLGIPGLERAEPVGEGGFATVFKARQPAFARTVAVKVLTGTHFDEDSRLRFERELQALGLLSEHPGIVTVHGTGFTTDGRPYLTMAFVEEGTLEDRLKADGAMPWPEAVKILVRLCGALETAHRSRIIHRDIKPANVLLALYGAQLSDFGIARIAGAHETQSGVITASIAYASPEVLDGERPTELADIYSLGSTAYAMLLGRSPFERASHETFIPLMLRIQTEAPPDLVDHGVPEDLAALLAQTLSKAPADRPSSALEFGERLQDVMRAHGRIVPELILAPDLIAEVDATLSATEVRPAVARDGGGTPGIDWGSEVPEPHPQPQPPPQPQAPQQPPPQQPQAPSLAPSPPPPHVPQPAAPPVQQPPSQSRRRRVAGALVATGLLAAVAVGVAVAARDDGGGGSADPTVVPPSIDSPVTVPATVPATAVTAPATVATAPVTDVQPETTLGPISAEPVCNSGEGFLPAADESVQLIFDTGVGVGIDDLGALAILHVLADADEVEILATMVSAGGDPAAGPTIDAVNTYYGRPDLPVGVVSGPAPSGESPYTAEIAAGFSNDLVDPPAAVDLYREVLAGQPDGSVTIVSGGFLTNLALLLASPPDDVSELTGEELVAAKVTRWVAMGGAYPRSADFFDDPEFNFAEDPTAAQGAITDWPTPVVFSGYEVGTDILTGAVLQTSTPAENPVREGYRLWGGAADLKSFDLSAVLVAVRGTAGGAFEVCTGLNMVGSDGATIWENRAVGPQAYLRTVAPNDEIAAILDDLLVRDPAS